MKEDEKCMHAGHRERLLELAVNAGFDAMSDVQVVEFFLTYILPRGDVNPLAHRLLNEYKDFYHILNAETYDLTRVNGLNDRSSKKINVFKEFFDYYMQSRIGKRPKIGCVGDLVDIVEELMRFRNTENILLLALSPANIVIQRRILDGESSRQISLAKSELAVFISSSKASSIAIAHTHPYGYAYPSKADTLNFEELKKMCYVCGVEFIDSYIIGEDGVFSQKEDKRIRTYCDVEDLKIALSELKNK